MRGMKRCHMARLSHDAPLPAHNVVTTSIVWRLGAPPRLVGGLIPMRLSPDRISLEVLEPDEGLPLSSCLDSDNAGDSCRVLSLSDNDLERRY